MQQNSFLLLKNFKNTESAQLCMIFACFIKWIWQGIYFLNMPGPTNNKLFF